MNSKIFGSDNIIRNRYENWCALKKKVETCNWLDEVEDKAEVYVYVSCEAEDIESDVLTLQYFFPIADIIAKCGKKSKLIICLPKCVKLNIQDTSFPPEVMRIQHYLYIQANLRKSVEFEIRYKQISGAQKKTIVLDKFSQTSFGRISPVIFFENDNSVGELYGYQKAFKDIESACKDVIRHKDNDELSNYPAFLECLRNLWTYYTSFDNKTEHFAEIVNSVEYQTILGYDKIVSEQFKKNASFLISMSRKSEEDQRENKKEITNKLPLTPLFNLAEGDSLDIIYFKLFLDNINHIFEYSIKGTPSQQMEMEGKNNVAQELYRFIIGMDIPILAMYIWSLLVKYMFNERLLIAYSGNKGDDSYLIREKLEKAQYDAMSYAEGIYQLMENAVIHSERRCGYLSIRLHKTDRKCAIGELVNVAKRVALLRKEYPYADDFREPFYLEIRILDDSFNIQDKRNIGMLERAETSLKERLGKAASQADKADVTLFEDLKQLFTRTAQNQEDVITHYGLRVFEKTVLLNGGYFQACSVDHGYYALALKDKPIDRGILYFKGEVPQEGNDPGKKPKKRVANEYIESDYTMFYGGTDYSIIMPVYMDWDTKSETVNQKAEFMFDINDIEKEFLPYIIDLDMQNVNFEQANEKINAVDNLYQTFINQLPKKGKGTERIIYICPKAMTFSKVEILAKMLYKYSVPDIDGKNTNKDDRHLIAINFDNKQYINEFVRIYAVFCDRFGNFTFENKVIKTQIALCNGGKVRFVLCGEKLPNVRQTARLYTYYNSDASLEFVHTVGYLSRTEQEGPYESAPMFPFDLYLDVCSENLRDETSIQSYNNGKGSVDENKIWFVEHINQILDTDMSKRGYGCKISDIHISIGTKIHINTFYNAELLFHNYGNVCRFAYLIARDILKEYKGRLQNDNRKKICLIGYEEYSSLLLCQIKSILEKCMTDEVTEKEKSKAVEVITFLSEYDETENKSGWLWPEFYDFAQKKQKQIDDFVFYAILPIATTLTTVYKIRDIMEMICNKTNAGASLPIDLGKSVAMIVVGGIEHNEGKEFGYWKNVDEISKVITLNTDKHAEQKVENHVRYYFNPSCKWEASTEQESGDSDMFNCEQCQEDDCCLISVNKSSTIPKNIFEMYDNPRNTFRVTSAVNNSRVDSLLGYVKYTHLRDENTHYQFYIDYKKYCRDIDNQKKIKKWLKDSVRPKIDVNAFNIILSPLDKSNSEFLSVVISEAFESNVRLLHIEIGDAYKENIRTKFNYITEEYNRIKELRGGGKIDVYYVDTCIISGATMHRGQQFMNMLLMQSKEDMENVNIYKGAIVLINRNSCETIQNLLGVEYKDKFFYYMRLNAPSYNMHEGKCSACELSEQYNRMHKRSSTYLIANEYTRLQEKHAGKDLEKHEYWLQKNIIELEGYFERFVQRLYYSVLDGKIIYYIDANDSLQKDNVRIDDMNSKVNLSKLYDKICAQAGGGIKYSSIEELATAADIDPRDYNHIVYFMKKHVISGRDFIRLKSTHNAFMELEEIMRGCNNYKDAEEKTRQAILTLLRNEFGRIDDVFNSQKSYKQTRENELRKREDYRMWMKAEWLISYIKILSRKQIAQYYHVRAAIYGILHDLLDGMLELTEKDVSRAKEIDFLVKPCKVCADDTVFTSFPADIKLKILLIAIRRLSALHSGYVLTNMERLYEFYQKCRKQYNAEGVYGNFYLSEICKNTYLKLFSFMSEKKFHIEMAKYIKWAAMVGYDESKCFAAEKRLSKVLKESSEGSFHTGAELSYLENTQVIFDGINRIAERFNGRTAAELLSHTKKIYEDALTHDSEKPKYYSLSTHKHFFYFMRIGGKELFDRERDRQNILYANMCAYFLELRKIALQQSIVDSPYPYTRICNYIRDIAGYQQCRMICEDNQRVYTLVTSDIHINYFNNDISDEEIKEYIGQFHNNSDGVIGDVVQKNYLGEKNATEALFIKILLYDELSVYIMLYRQREGMDEKTDTEKEISSRNTEEIIVQDLWNVRNILFMRDHLETALHRDIIALRDMIHSYRYVGRISSADAPRILHISDLHIKESDTDENDAIKNLIERTNFKETDLMLITGDVIQGSHSAATLESNYNAAGEIIQCIAKKVWRVKSEISELDEYVRSDWKKRIQISTGNHDYASMNELETQNKLRATTAGVPSSTIGGTMIKHSYFIDFLRRFLGVEIDKLVWHDLNSFVDYEKMKLTVVNINTNSGVNPYRTNKVAISEEKLKTLCKNQHYNDYIVYMMHHTPIYTIDYVADSYYIWDNDVLSRWQEYFETSGESGIKIEEVHARWISLLKKIANNFNNIKEGDSCNDDETLLKLVQIVKKYHKDIYMEKTLFDIEAFLRIKRSNRRYDDRCRNLQSYITEKIQASELDAKRYRDCVNGLLGALPDRSDKGYWIIGGHTHQAAHCNGGFKGQMKDCIEILEAGKFATKIESRKKAKKVRYKLAYENFHCDREGRRDLSSGIPQKTIPLK